MREDEIQVWVIPVETSPRVCALLSKVLSAEEQDRTRRLAAASLRNRSVFSRGILRVMLSRYLRIPPSEIILRLGSRGKPALPSPHTLRFNVSHSGDRMLLAFMRSCEVGVDIEQIRDVTDCEAIARRFFAPGESRALSDLSADARAEAFFRCWTRKEAYLKAVGAGLAAPLDGFEVTLEAGCPHFLHLPPGSGTCSLYDIDAGPGYTAALAHRGPARDLRVNPIHLNDVLGPSREPDSIPGQGRVDIATAAFS